MEWTIELVDNEDGTYYSAIFYNGYPRFVGDNHDTKKNAVKESADYLIALFPDEVE